MTPEIFILEFWQPKIQEDYCPRLVVNAMFEESEVAKVCASLMARGYQVQVYKLEKVETPEIRK